MKQTTSALIALAVAAASISAAVYVSQPSEAQARDVDVQMISFPRRAGVIYQEDEEYDEEERLETLYRKGYELETVIERTHPDAPPILVFKR